MHHTFEAVDPKVIAERLSFMLHNGWEFFQIAEFAVTLKSESGSFHTFVSTPIA